MLGRRHSQKPKKWLSKQHWSATLNRNVFAVRTKSKKNRETLHRVQRVSAIGIRRYIKIKADANPYLPEYAQYFWQRRHDKKRKLLPAMSAPEYRAMAA